MQKELKILLLSSGLFMLAGGLFGPIYAVFVEEIGGNLMTAGAAYGVFAIAAGILMFFVSRWEDRVKHQEKLIVIGYGLNCLGYFGYLFIRNPMDLFLVQIIFGIGKAIEIPAFDGVYSKHLDHGKFASEWGLWDSTTYIAFGVSAVMGGFLASIYGFKVLFVIMLVLSLFGLFTSMLLMVEKKKKQIKHS